MVVACMADWLVCGCLSVPADQAHAQPQLQRPVAVVERCSQHLGGQRLWQAAPRGFRGLTGRHMLPGEGWGEGAAGVRPLVRLALENTPQAALIRQVPWPWHSRAGLMQCLSELSSD